jgi:hypothetical protein
LTWRPAARALIVPDFLRPDADHMIDLLNCENSRT